jgi:hypothetical protein
MKERVIKDIGIKPIGRNLLGDISIVFNIFCAADGEGGELSYYLFKAILITWQTFSDVRRYEFETLIHYKSLEWS